MTHIPNDWFTDPSKPWRGVKRQISIDCILPAEAWLSVRAIIESTPPEDMSRRAFFPPMMFSCAQCQTPVRRNAFEMKKAEKRGKAAVYCSLSCNQIAVNLAAGKTGPNCNICGVKIPKGNRQCSAACKAVALKKRAAWKVVDMPTQLCETCNAPFRPYARTVAKRFCSRVCKDRGHSEQMEGKNNPCYRTGNYPARKSPRSARRWRKARPEIIERDGAACVVCQATEPLEVHHIDMNAANNRWSNLVTLCAPCHRLFHAGERSKPKVTRFGWLSAYASQPRCSTSKWKAPAAFSQMEF